VHAAHPAGLTDSELRALIDVRLGRVAPESTYRKRRTELTTLGLIEPTNLRRVNPKGSMECVWRLATSPTLSAATARSRQSSALCSRAQCGSPHLPERQSAPLSAISAIPPTPPPLTCSLRSFPLTISSAEGMRDLRTSPPPPMTLSASSALASAPDGSVVSLPRTLTTLSTRSPSVRRPTARVTWLPCTSPGGSTALKRASPPNSHRSAVVALMALARSLRSAAYCRLTRS
jgi:hypothetical protein